MPGCEPSVIPNRFSCGVSSSLKPVSVICIGTVWIVVRPLLRPLRFVVSTLTYETRYVSVGLPAGSSIGTSDGVV
jgi:hypothetical protein